MAGLATDIITDPIITIIILPGGDLRDTVTVTGTGTITDMTGVIIVAITTATIMEFMPAAVLAIVPAIMTDIIRPSARISIKAGQPG